MSIDDTSTTQDSRAAAAADAVNEEATYGSQPLLKEERIWRARDFTWVNISLAIATWAFLIGGSTALLVGFQQGLAAMVIGNAVGGAIMLLGSVAMSQRYGVEQYRILKSVFGGLGIAIVVFTIVMIIEMGWSSLLGVMVGRAFTQISNQIFGTAFESNSFVVTAFALAAIALAWAVLSRGPMTISKLNRFVAPGLLIVVVFMMVLVLNQSSWQELWTANPLAPFDDDALNFAVAVEFNVGAGLSWWPVMGTLARLTKSPQAALWPAYTGILVGSLAAEVVGLAAALTLGDSDPTAWMVPLGGPVLGALVLVFVGFANVTSMSSIVYSTVLAIKQSSGRLLQRVSWPWLCALFFILPAIMSFFPDFMYDQFMTFVVIGGAFIAAICGVIVADYFILRKQIVPLRALYERGPDEPLRFHGGINVAAMVAVVIASVFYMVIYNPITLETLPIFRYLTASLPTAVLAAVLYLPLASLLYKRRQRGGYHIPDVFTQSESE